jgi:glycerol uptake facilitator-like aquaporin
MILNYVLTTAYREHLREPFAEFVGVMVLILFGNGVNCQVTLSKGTAGVSVNLDSDTSSRSFIEPFVRW